MIDDTNDTGPISTDPTGWVNRIRGGVDLDGNPVCVCGQPAERGKRSCRGCLAAEARIRFCTVCGDPAGEGINMCPGCARAGAEKVSEAVAAGLPLDALTNRQVGGENMRATQQAQGTNPVPPRVTTRAQRRSERDAREADALDRMRSNPETHRYLTAPDPLEVLR